MNHSAAPSASGDRIAQIRASIPSSVRLIAVTKGFPAAAIRTAYAAGIRDFGENRIQEALDKQAELQDLGDITWHLIGHLQSNKTAKAVESFDWIHSVDSLKLAERLDRLAAEQGRSPKVCLQVKLRPDPSKYGWSAELLLEDLPALNQLQHLKICGLMAIPPLNLDDAETLMVFQDTYQLGQTINQLNLNNLQIQELSMGMSADYPLAIQAGSTMIRLGRLLFGERT